MIVDRSTCAIAEACANGVACEEGKSNFLLYVQNPTEARARMFFSHALKCPSCALAMQDFCTQSELAAIEALSRAS